MDHESENEREREGGGRHDTPIAEHTDTHEAIGDS